MDGVDHINIYSKGQTELGRLLSNFAACTIMTEDGPFRSIEGYWYWLLADPTNFERDALHHMYGFKAKERGRLLQSPQQFVAPAEFRRKIRKAVWAKIQASPRLRGLMLANTLPYRHYYNYGGKIVEPEGSLWLIRFIERCADCLRS